ncbi:hypothetical protein Tco_0108912 [Tanacetum coccineum]
MFQRSRSKAPSDSVTILPRASGKIGVVELYSWTNYQLADILTKQYKRTVRICSSTPKHEEFEPRKLSDAFKKERMNKRSVLCYPLLNNSGGIAVQVTFSSQSMTTALSIENGSLFEGESEFENLLHHTALSIEIGSLFEGESEFEKLKIYLITLVLLENTMAEQNVPAQAPARTDEQIVPRSQWLQIGKSNLLFDAQKIQKNPIFQISFWNSMKYDEKTRVYSCQVDEQWFNISDDLLRKALDITPVDPAHPFELPPTGDMVIDFVNQMGYPEPYLTGKTSGSDKPRHPVLQMLWGIVTQTNVDHAELLKDPKKKAVPLLIPYGQFTKMIIYYLGSTSDVHKRPESPCHLPGDDFLLGNLKFISKGETNEVFGMTIPKQLITQAIQQSLYYPKYLEMVAKNTKKTPQDSASKQPEPATKRAPPKKPTTTTPVKPTKTPSSKQPKSPTKKPSKRKLPQKVRKGKPSFQLVDEDDEAQQESVPQEEGDDPDLELAKKMSLDAHQEKGEGREPVGGVTIRDPVSETTTKLPEVVGKGKVIVTEEQVAHSLIDLSKKKRTTDHFILVRRDQAPHDSTTGPSSQPEDDTSEKVIHESSSTSDSERTESETEAAAPKGDKELGEVDSSTVSSGVSIPVSTQGQAGSDPEKAHEALVRPDPEPMQEDQTGSDSGKVHVSLAGPNPKHMDDKFLATAYPKVHENLKLIIDERVIEDNPESHSGSMSSMKNLEDTVNFGDQFLYDKPIEDDQEKSKVVDESDSTIPDSSHQTVTSTPPVIAPLTDFSSHKPSSLVTPPPINTKATTITTFLLNHQCVIP